MHFKLDFWSQNTHFSHKSECFKNSILRNIVFFYSTWCLEKFKKYENTTLAIERVQVYCLKKKNVHADMLCGVRGKIGRWQKICGVLIFERKVKVRGCIVYCIGYLKHVKYLSSVYTVQWIYCTVSFKI